MALVASLLDLPKTSKGFEGFGFSALEQPHDGSASPRRKIARLDTDSDIGSRSNSVSGRTYPSGPFIIQIIGEDEPTKHKPIHDNAQPEVNKVGQFVKTILSALPGSDNNGTPPVTNERVYKACRAIVMVHGAGTALYEKIEFELDQALIKLEKHVATYDAGGERKWLGFFAKCCNWFEGTINLLQSILTYLDRVHVTKHSDTIAPFKELAYSLFAKRVFRPRVHDLIQSGITKWLAFERETGERAEEHAEVAELIKHLIAHQQYHTMFEEFYINITQAFYQEESTRVGETLKDNPKGLFDHIETRVKQETDRAASLLPVGSWAPILEATERALLCPHAVYLANSLVTILLQSRDVETLAKLYSRYARINDLKVLSDAFRNHIQSQVKTIVTENDKDDEMVERLLTLKKLADEAVDRAFVTSLTFPRDGAPTTSGAATETRPDKDFLYALSDAFTQGFRSRRRKPAEMLAKHLDKQLRKGQKEMKDAEYKTDLVRVLPLYRYTEDRDVFRTHYQRMLAKRILLSRAASDEIEKWLLEELKESYDPEFAKGPEMFKDISLSNDLMERYHEKDPDSSNFHAAILTEGAWPLSRSKIEVNLPLKMQDQLDRFSRFYSTTGPNRKLHWDPAFATVTMKSRFKEGLKELSLTLFQALVLLLFNESDEIPLKEIAQQTNLDDGELRRTLQSLACGKKKVLKKVPPGKDVGDNDVFVFNADFSDPHHRVHISTIQEKVSVEEAKKTDEAIDHDRIHTLEAAIVRLMKGRKEMTYQQLSMATVEAVKNHFNPDRDVIKKTIDSLVEREYMERSEDDLNRFKYVA